MWDGVDKIVQGVRATVRSEVQDDRLGGALDCMALYRLVEAVDTFRSASM